MRWSAGPLDIAQREKEKGFTAKSKEVLERWLDPSVLEILRGTPVNCLVVNWAAGLPADAEQQKALAPLLARGKAAGLSFVGLVEGKGDQTAAVASARAAGLEAVIMEGEAPNAGLPIIPVAARPQLPWKSSSPVLVAKGNVWPGIANQGLNSQDWRHEDDSQASGPTADPWIDSNGWFLRLAKTCAPLQDSLAAVRPAGIPRCGPAGGLSARGYGHGVLLRAVGCVSRRRSAGEPRPKRAEGHGDVEVDRRRAGLLCETQPVGDDSPLGLVGVVSDFAGDNEMIGTETLNLMVKMRVPFRIIEKPRLATTPLTGYKALISVDGTMPEPAARKKLIDFAQQGGALLVSESWKGEGGTPTGAAHPRLDLRKLGKGKFAVCKADPDPYMVARDIHVLLGRANDLSRFFNISSFLSMHTAPPDGASALLQMTNFAKPARFFDDSRVTVWFPQQYRAARMWTLGSEAPVPLTLVPENTGMDVQIPAVAPYAAVEVALQKLA